MFVDLMSQVVKNPKTGVCRCGPQWTTFLPLDYLKQDGRTDLEHEEGTGVAKRLGYDTATLVMYLGINDIKTWLEFLTSQTNDQARFRDNGIGALRITNAGEAWREQAWNL
jgi:hypothetical protein